MKFETAINTFDTILQNGPLGTRLKYDYGFEKIFDSIEQEKGKKALSILYENDIAIAQEHQLPIILNAASFRASKNHLHTSGFKQPEDVKRINESCINFIKEIKNNYYRAKAPIIIGAPVGSMYDSYNTNIIPNVAEAKTYHQEQISLFKQLGVDFINAVTLPSVTEALGISLMAEKFDICYSIGFILNHHATLLDGTDLNEAIKFIDSLTNKPPIGYLITCTHTSIIEKLAQHPSKYKRLIGIQPNGASLPPQVLATMEQPIADSPEEFSQAILYLKQKLGLTIVSGCCGTNKEHLKFIAQAFAPI